MTPSGRIAAAIDLTEAIEATLAAPRGRPADATANDFFRSRRYIGSGDRRAVSERAWRVLRQRRRLGWWLAHVGLPSTPRLLVAASLLLDGWTAAGVAQTYSGGQYAPETLLAEERTALRGLEGRSGDHPQMPNAVRLEVPDWLLPHLDRRFGPARDAELEGLGEAAPLDLRVNLLKATREAARAALAEEGIAAEPTPFSPWGLRIAGRRPVVTGPAFRDGLVEIQDEGSQLVAALVGATAEMRVVDYCAGAAGKTLALAMTMGNRGHIVACDVSPARLDGAVKRLRRAGVHNVERHLLTMGDKWAKRRAASFDRVLVDAPCTGTGTWRRNPDARLRLRAQDLEELAAKQAAILAQAARLVRPGGRLVYATCSLLAEENEGQITTFLDGNKNFALVPPPAEWPQREGFLTLSPARHDTDGFFAAILARDAAA